MHAALRTVRHVCVLAYMSMYMYMYMYMYVIRGERDGVAAGTRRSYDSYGESCTVGPGAWPAREARRLW